MFEPICECSLRAATTELLSRRLREGEDVLVDELLMPDARSRIDLAMVNGHVEAFELKSDHDTLRRLPQQCENLRFYFDRLTIVCTSKHLQGSERLIPTWWGLIEAVRTSKGIGFKRHRQARSNPDMDLVAQLALLWREDLEKLARDMKKAPEKPGSMTKPELCRWIANASPGPVFMRRVRSALKNRVRLKLALR